MEPNADPRLAPTLAERLRAHAAPTPGEAYFAALPDRVASRVRQGGGPLAARRTAPDRAPARRGAPRRALLAAAASALAVLLVLVYVLPRTGTPPQRPRAAQARIPAPVPEAKRDSAAAAPLPDPDSGGAQPQRRAPEKGPARKELAPRRTIRPQTPPRAQPTTARPRGLRLASAQETAAPSDPDTPPAFIPADPTSPALVRTLERARIVLLTLAHTDSTDDLGVLQPLAESLAADLVSLRAAIDTADPAVRSVAHRLEPFLQTLARYDQAPAAMATLRSRLRDDETLFRLDVALLAAGPAVPVD